MWFLRFETHRWIFRVAGPDKRAAIINPPVSAVQYPFDAMMEIVRKKGASAY